ncbi:MAG: hypothetical protein ACREXT_10150 [Gammaproteobacteria bacterium]
MLKSGIRWLIGGVSVLFAVVQLETRAQEVLLPDISLVESSTVTEIPTPKVGEVREYVGAVASVNCGRWTVIEAGDEDSVIAECPPYKIHFKKSDHLNMHKITGAGDEPVLVFEPSYPGIEFPLSVGQNWHRQYHGYSAIEGLRWEGDLACEVADYAEVKVAAGTFKAYRIECNDNWAAGQMESRVSSTTWYAPAVNGVVKTVTYEDPRWNSELKAYSQ